MEISSNSSQPTAHIVQKPIDENEMVIIKEAEVLAKKGIKEIIIIAQDTTKYGVDLYGEPN